MAGGRTSVLEKTKGRFSLTILRLLGEGEWKFLASLGKTVGVSHKEILDSHGAGGISAHHH